MTEIRAWTKKDLRDVQQVAWETWASAYGPFIPEEDRQEFHEAYYSIEKLEKLYSSPFVDGCVAEVDGKVVGYSKTFWKEEEGRFYITSLYVLPEYQKLHLGKKMMDFGIETAKNYKVDRVWLGVMVDNKPAIDWYLRQGFTFTVTMPFTIGNTVIDHLNGYKLI